MKIWKILKIFSPDIDIIAGFGYYNMRVFAFVCPCLDNCDTGIEI